MMDAGIIVWFTWFLAANWVRLHVDLLKERIAKGVGTMKKTVALILPVFLAAAFLLALPARAAAVDDPPGRVARLNFIQGAVSFQPGGQKDWVEADSNRPLTAGDNLWSDEKSRGELHIGSTVLRLSSESGISFLNLNDRTTQIQLAQGSLFIHIRHLDDDEAFEVDTPNLAFSILRAGEYRLDVNEDGTSTSITVRGGSGEVTGGGTSYNLTAGQQATFTTSQDAEKLEYSNQPASDPDEFDKWCMSRDHKEEKSASAKYVSRDVPGYDDLDANGTWRTDPVYGPVWAPTAVAVGWAPYRYGHWVWVAPWGWTWVDASPWGFAPYHYGRWAFVGAGWVWVPGPVAVVGIGGPVVAVVRPVYAPHLVAFVGGGGFSASIAIGGGVAGVAWVPIGPRDVWVPGYHASATYVQNVNVSNTTVVNRTQVTNVYNTSTTNVNVNKTAASTTYMNQSAPGAVTAVPQKTFANGQPVAASAVPMSAQQAQHPQVVNAAPVAPTSKAIAGPAAAASAKPPAALANRPVVTKLNPSPQAVPLGHTQPLAAGHPAAQTAKLNQAAGPPPANKFTPPAHANSNSTGSNSANTSPQPAGATPHQTPKPATAAKNTSNAPHPHKNPPPPKKPKKQEPKEKEPR